MTKDYVMLRFVGVGKTTLPVRHPLGVQLPVVGDLAMAHVDGKTLTVKMLTGPQFEYAEDDNQSQRLVFVNYVVKSLDA